MPGDAHIPLHAIKGRGAATRLAYHGIASLKDGEHPLTGRSRINLTFRKAL